MFDQIQMLKNAHERKTEQTIDTSWFLRMEYDNKPVSEIKTPTHLMNASPILWPLGAGAIDEPSRRKKISYREHVEYLLRLNSDKFRTHKSFIFVALNIIERTEARIQNHLLIKKCDFDKFSNEISLLTEHDFEQAIADVIKTPKDRPKNAISKLLMTIQIASANVRGSLAALKFGILIS